MRTMDLASLWRSTIGFDRFFDLVEDSPWQASRPRN
jgi:hypothetical protein